MNLSIIVRAGRVVSILAWAFFLVYAWMTGRLMVIHPSYRWLSLAAAVVLGVVAVALLLDRRADSHACDHDHDDDSDAHAHGEGCGCGDACHAPPGKSELFFQCVVLVPIIASVLLGRGGLSAQAMATRGVKLMPAVQSPPPSAPAVASALPPSAIAPTTTTTLANPFAAMEEALPPMTLSDIHFAMMMGRREDMEGRRVEVLGQHYIDDRCGPGEFCVVRILVTCCLADAEVMGLLVKPKKPYTPGSSKSASDAVDNLRLPNEPGALDLKMRLQEQGPWIEVTGKLKAVRDRRGYMLYCITDAEVKDAQPPAEILLYPKPMTSW